MNNKKDTIWVPLHILEEAGEFATYINKMGRNSSAWRSARFKRDAGSFIIETGIEETRNPNQLDFFDDLHTRT
jgi:hypothetical protein